MAKWLKLSTIYTLSTSPNLCHHTTLLNTDVPDCHIHWNLLFVSHHLMTELSHSKLKYGLFNREDSSTKYRLDIVRIYAQKYALRALTQVHR